MAIYKCAYDWESSGRKGAEEPSGRKVAELWTAAAEKVPSIDNKGPRCNCRAAEMSCRFGTKVLNFRQACTVDNVELSAFNTPLRYIIDKPTLTPGNMASSTDRLYDLCVIGAGMIGSGAARHASLIDGVSVCVIGPGEPESRSVDDGREIYGAHYDEGRITRNTDTDPAWALFAQESIKRYRELEKASGINFYEEAGYLIAGDKDGDFMQQSTQIAEGLNTDYFDPAELKKKFPYFDFNSNDAGIYERKSSGFISPRKMIQAQLKIAQSNGCDVISDVVFDIASILSEDKENIMEIKTDSGNTYLSKKVLIATGAFTSFRNLLGKDIRPDVDLLGANVAKVEINEDTARKLRGMPSVYYFGKGKENWCKEFPGYQNGEFSFYMLPPIKYPDNKYFIKMGFGSVEWQKRLSSKEEVKNWYCSGGIPAVNKAVATLITNVVKDIPMTSYHGDCCVICGTPTRKPYIDMIHSQLGVAIGGNGWAAKSGDEIGRIAAMLVIKNEWDSPLPKESFKFRCKGENCQ